MSPSKIITVVTLFLITTSSGFGFINKVEYSDDEHESKVERQIGIYGGYAFSQNINNAHGDHGSFSGQNNETSIEGIVVEQSWDIGISARYYFSNYLGIDVDAMYSQAEFPEQQVSLNGFLINQPKSNLEFYTLSIGPSVRYKADDIWQFLNPYASISLSVLLGNASDVNLYPEYGKGGLSILTGLGFNFRLGMQYEFNQFGISLEYRFESLSVDVDHFRSFTEGINFNKNGSYINIGSYYHF